MKKTFFLTVLLAVFWGIPKSVAQAEPYLGQIIAVPYNFAPRGWAMCSGQLLSIQQNTALFSLLGVTYGGNGTTTFALPNLNGRALVGAGQGPGLDDVNLGQTGGSATVTLTTANLPAHNHALNASIYPGVTNVPTNNSLANTSEGDREYATTRNTIIGNTGVTGVNQPISVMQPYLGMYYIIAIQGFYPPRP